MQRKSNTLKKSPPRRSLGWKIRFYMTLPLALMIALYRTIKRRVTRKRLLICALATGRTILLLLADYMILSSVNNSDVIPGLYFAILATALLVIDIIVVFLTLEKKQEDRHPEKRNKKIAAQQIIGMAIAVLMCLAGVYINYLMNKLSTTLDVITSQADGVDIDYKSTKVHSYRVYVLADDPAKALDDASDYTFSFASVETDEVNARCIDSIENEVGQDIKSTTAETVFELVDSLYSGNAGAIVLNVVYDEILEESEGYFGFLDLTSCIYEFSIIEAESGRWDEPTKEDVQSVDGADIIELPEPEKTVVDNIITAPFIVYISGSDSWEKTLTVSRSDVNLLAVVNPTTRQVLLLNTPRDYYVPNPVGNGAPDKLTHCGIYGINCSMEALAGLYNIEIDYYVRLNFNGFETLIDAIGGIDVESDVAFIAQEAVDQDYRDYQIVKGINHLNGSQALAFVRERKALAGGDGDRGRNQMKAISGIVQKLSIGTILMNYSDILDSMQDMLSTNMPRENISSLVKMQLENMFSWNIQSFAVTGYGGSDITYSIPDLHVYVMYPDEASVKYAAELISRIKNGDVLSSDDLTIH